MWLTLLAVVVGIAAGLVSGASPLSIGRARPIAGVLAIAWLALTAVTRWVEVPQAHAVFIVANVAALMFCAVNVRKLGTGLLLVGVALNTLVIALNGSMPYRVSSVISAGLANSASDFPSTVQSRPERPGDLLMALADVIPVKAGFVHDVLSIGDVLAAFGIAWVVYRAMDRNRSRQHSGNPSPPASANASHPHAGLAESHQSTTPRRPSVQSLVARSTLRLGEEFDLLDDDFDALVGSDSSDLDVPVTASAVTIVVDLTIDRHRYPDRHLVDLQPDSDVMRLVLGTDNSAVGHIPDLLDLTDGELPGAIFWAERTKQIARQNHWDTHSRQETSR